MFDAISAAYFAGDWEGAFALIDPEIDWIEPKGMPGSAAYHGHDGVRESLTKFVGTWADYRVTHHDIAEAGNHLYARAHITGKGKTSGVPVELNQFQVWTFRDGNAVRTEMFLDENEARSAAGLAPAEKEPAR